MSWMKKSVVKNYFTTASDGKQYDVTFYSLDMILSVGFRVRNLYCATTFYRSTPCFRRFFFAKSSCFFEYLA